MNAIFKPLDANVVMKKNCPGSTPQANDSYWSIAGVKDLYSSLTNTMVKKSDPQCAHWLGTHVLPIPMPSLEELAGVLKAAKVLPLWLWDAQTFIQPKVGEYTKDQLKAYARSVSARKTEGTVEARLRALELRAAGDPSSSDEWLAFMANLDTTLKDVGEQIDAHKVTKLEQVNAAFGEPMAIVNITTQNDADFYRTFVWQTIAGSPLDLSGGAMEMMLRRHAEDKAAVLRLATDTEEIVFVNAMLGEFTLRISQDVLEHLGLGDFDHSNIFTRSDYKVRVWSGVLHNNAGATR